MFLGDAHQRAELRPPSLKGALRFWYRAAEPKFAEREGRVFGAAGDGVGQSAVLMRIVAPDFAPMKWPRQMAQRFNSGQGRGTRNGLVYLGYPFQFNERTAIPPGTCFTVHCTVPRPERLSARDAWGVLGAWWLLGRYGALGTRARRGFGSLQLDAWSLDGGGDAWHAAANALPVVERPTPQVWFQGLANGLHELSRRLGAFPEPTHQPHLGPRARPVLLPTPARGRDAWASALAEAGRLMQDFRLRRQPDYDRVKSHVRKASGEEGRNIEGTPGRAAFGLPLTFRFSSLPRGRPVTFVPGGRVGNKPAERHGSLIHIKLVELADGLHPLFVRLDGDVPGGAPPAALRGRDRALAPADASILDTFMAHLVAR